MSADLPPDGPRTASRRRLLATGSAAAAGVWVAPSVVRMDRIAAATGSLAALTFYLHNNPTPPTADTSSQPTLPLDCFAPTATSLFNYDDDRDAFAGLLLKKGDGLAETDPTKYQRWISDGSAAIDLSGTISVNVWTAMKDFEVGKSGSIVVGLYDCDATESACSLVARNTFSLDPWPPTWQEISVDLGTVTYTIPAGRRMVVHLATLNDSDDDLWFAYDTTINDSNLTIN